MVDEKDSINLDDVEIEAGEDTEVEEFDLEPEDKPLGWYFFIPIFIVVAVVPLITFAKEVSLYEIEALHWKGGSKGLDFFSYYKYLVFSVFAFVSVFILLVLKFKRRIELKETKYYIPLAVYIVFVLASYLLSDYFMVSYRGFIEQFQGVWVMIGYGFMIFALYNYVENENQVKMILGAFIFSASLVGILGISQYFGFDFFKTNFGRHLILPESLHYMAEKLKFTFSDYTIYATMYNTNFVGSFSALLVPVGVFAYLYSKKLIYKVLSFAFALLMLFVWIGCNSRAGYLGLSFGIVLSLILYRKKIKEDLRKILILLLSFVIMVVYMNGVSDGRVLRQFSRLNPFAEGDRLEEIQETQVRFEDIKFEGNSVAVITNEESVRAELSKDNELLFYDLKGERLKVDVDDEGNISFEDVKYEEFSAKLETDRNRFLIDAYGKSMAIYFTDEGFMMAGSSGVIKKTEYPPYLGIFDGREKFASSRGYIWSRSVPMLKDTLLVGYGPDTYALEFPQHDYVGKLNSFSSHRMIVDKPHNMYLQIGINTGLISLIGLIALYLMYFIESIKLYIKRDISTFLDYIGVGAFVGVMSYLAAGMFNDQIISVAPLFYTMVGLGLAVNRILRANSSETIEKL
jgi:hypothetical protein